MHTLRVALAQINALVGDLAGNLQLVLSTINRARQVHADLVLFPELVITGCPPEDLLLKSCFIDENRRTLAEAARSCVGLVAVIGYVEQAPALVQRGLPQAAAEGERCQLYNAAAVVADGRHLFSFHKRLFRRDGTHDEGRYFRPGRPQGAFDLQGVRVSVTVGEDIWSVRGSGIAQSFDADLIVNIGAFPFRIGRRRLYEQMSTTCAKENGVIVACANLVGGQDELVFDGNSVVVDQRGEIVARAKAFEEDFLVVDISFDDRLKKRSSGSQRKGALKKKADFIERRVVTVSNHGSVRSPLAPRVEPVLDELEGVYRALVVGVRDYARKNRFVKVVIGLSGGIDSALTAAIAVDALGPEQVVGLCMPSPYTSVESMEDAVELSHRLAIQCLTIPITPLFEAYRHLLAPVFHETRVDQTEENLQARIRGTILMAFSNKFGHLVLTTGNKSEMSVGYATLYGDMAGGFAVLKDVPKTMVYELARLRNGKEAKAVIPQRILDRPPTAELRPNQKDEDSLPPYSILDPILKSYIEESRSVEEIIARGFDRETVVRVAGLVAQSEYKRRQAPVGVTITSRGFGKEWRMPITNGYRDG